MGFQKHNKFEYTSSKIIPFLLVMFYNYVFFKDDNQDIISWYINKDIKCQEDYLETAHHWMTSLNQDIINV